jgi:hypothetical protein
MRPHYTLKLTNRTALVRALKEVCLADTGRKRLNGDSADPVLQGWVNHFAVAPFQRALQLHQRLGGEEVRRHLVCSETKGLRLGTME